MRCYICWILCCVGLFVVFVDLGLIDCNMAEEIGGKMENGIEIDSENGNSTDFDETTASFDDFEDKFKKTNSILYYTSTYTGHKMRSVVWIGVHSWQTYTDFMEALCRTPEAKLPELNDDTVIYRDLYFLWERQTFHDALVKFLVLENSLYRRPHFIDEGIQSHCYIKHAKDVDFEDFEIENYDIENNAHFENRMNRFIWGEDVLLTVPYPFD